MLMYRKCFMLLCIYAILLLFSGCDYSTYKDACTAMAYHDYATAYDAFTEISTYKDSEALSKECLYQIALEYIDNEEYLTAYSTLLQISDYGDVSEKLIYCSKMIGRNAVIAKYSEISLSIAEMDYESLFDHIYDYRTMEHSYPEIVAMADDYVICEITKLLDSLDYDAYLFMDQLIESVSQDISFASIREKLVALNKAYELNRAKAFLSGTWIKIDNWQNTGLRVKIISDEENTIGMILEDLESTHPDNSRAVFKWYRGVLEFNNIQIIDSQTVILDHLDLYVYYNLKVQSVSYEPAIARLDYENRRLILQETAGAENYEWLPNTNSEIYLREDAFVESPAITDDDFIVSLTETSSQYDGDILNLNEWFSSVNNCFYMYEGNDIATTSRGITVGSTYNDVINVYGYGEGNHFVEELDPIVKKLKKVGAKDTTEEKNLYTILAEQADEYVRYQLGDSEQYIRIYFKDKVVTWICLYISS